MRAAPFQILHRPADLQARRDRRQQMDMIPVHAACMYHHLMGSRSLADQLTTSLTDIAAQHLAAILRNPHQMILAVPNCMVAAFVRCHNGSLYCRHRNPMPPKRPDVREFLARPDCRIHLIQLPLYCRHLNPASQRTHAFACRPMIERLWAVMHQYVTYNRQYPTQKQCADAILTFFRETLPKQWTAFRDSVSDNFRVMSHDGFRVLE